MRRRQGTAGIILAAGYGTRMLPLTEHVPKPLLPLLGTPLLELVAKRLLRSGATRLHANVHHLADRIEAFADDRRLPLTLHREEKLLGTGGGVGNMAEDLDRHELILLQNGDTVADIDLAPAIALHRERGALVTMIVLAGEERAGGVPLRRPPASVLVREDRSVAAIGAPLPAGRRSGRSMGYAGMAVLAPEALEFFPRGEAGGLVEALLDIIARRPGSVIAHDPEREGAARHWGEIGSIEGYLDIHRRILIERTVFDPLLKPPPLPIFAAEGSTIDPGVRWSGFLAAGSRARIERGVTLEDCIVLDGTVVREGSEYRRAVIYPGGAVSAL